MFQYIYNSITKYIYKNIFSNKTDSRIHPILFDDETEEECSICYHMITNNNKTTIHCGHTFCSTCIISYIRKNHNSCIKCPLCRYIIADEISTSNTIIPEDIMFNIIENEINRNSHLIEKNPIILTYIYMISKNIATTISNWYINRN